VHGSRIPSQLRHLLTYSDVIKFKFCLAMLICVHLTLQTS